MQQVVIGFWGWYFGTSVITLAIAGVAFGKSLRRISVNAALAVGASAFFTLSFLGWIEFDDADRNARFLSIVACIAASVLGFLLLRLMGTVSGAEGRRRAMALLAAVTAVAITIGSFLTPIQAQSLGVTMAGMMALGGLLLSVRNALRGDRSAWLVVCGVLALMVAIISLGWIATARQAAPWYVHAVGATAATCYVGSLTVALWMRYAYLVELRQVMALGPNYDPVTRMRSHGETSTMVGQVFKQFPTSPVPLGLIVISIANLKVLEQLYGLMAVNHALFVCAGRLRRIVPQHVEMGRLAGDSFLLLMRNCSDSGPLLKLAHAVQACLSQPVKLNTAFGAGEFEGRQTRWEAETGIGVLRVFRADSRASSAVAMGRGMSRTAWSYPSRVAWYDERRGEIVDSMVMAH